MKDRGKAVAVSSSSNNWLFSDSYYSSSSSDLPCRKHPSSSSVGVCAFCLKDRLIKLVCPDCGEQRLSSCSCSDISSSYRNSWTADVGSVGRISFLIENDKEEIQNSNTKPPHYDYKSDSNVLLKRSSSSSVDVKRSGFGRLGRFFRKKRDKGFGFSGINVDRVDQKGEIWDFGNMGVCRSRSVGGFRVGSSDLINKDENLESERKSIGGFNGFKSIKKGGFSDFDNGGFSCVEDSGFIDLNLGISSESKADQFSYMKSGDFLESESGYRVSKGSDFSESDLHLFEQLRDDGVMLSKESSCRISVSDKEMKKCKKSLNVWRWILKHHHSGSSGRTSFKKDE